MKFAKRNCIVEATRWFSPGDHPAVEQHDGVWSIATPEGWRDVKPGDWVITPPGDAVYCMQDSLFTSLYEPLASSPVLTAMLV
ncbi:hypothetical protein [Paraburkholderia megapolitana]|uniref:hypothetical protein n=1 Tax=Paraburkholderia megapolitana TaxID=420953 RepID=UPI0038BC12DE